jgi:hypothetical protein
MVFEKANVLNKNGVKQRVLRNTQTFFDLLVLCVTYQQTNFFIVSGEKKYIGLITKDKANSLILKHSEISPSCTLDKLCKSNQSDIVFKCDYSKNLDTYIDSMMNIFHSNQDILELPVVNTANGELIAIIDKEKFFSVYGQRQHHSLFPTNEWVFTKKHQYYEGGINSHSRSVYSQFGEDGIIEKLFSLIEMKNKFAVEFGGWDGIIGSNIRNLIINHGYSGLYIEGDPQKASACIDNYAGNEKVRCIDGYVGFIEQKKLDDYLFENHVPSDFDLLSIDIDGYDYHVWDSLKDFHPRVVIIEYNITIPNEVFFINPYSESLLQGSSASALVALGHKKGYELVAVTLSNCVFVKEEEYEKVGISDNRLETLRNENYLSDGVYFQTYDKQLLNKGYPRYFWG